MGVLVRPPMSRESSRPSGGVHRRSPLGTTYDAFGSERYVLIVQTIAPFAMSLRLAPYEFVEIVVNNRTYGGGGIFGLYSTVAADSEQAPYVFVHEFGHHMPDWPTSITLRRLPTRRLP